MCGRHAGQQAFASRAAPRSITIERLYCVASELTNFVHLFIGSGLGAGLYLCNYPYSGHWHNAGEIGHTTVIPGGKACSCGNQGCWSTWGRRAGRSGIGGGSLDDPGADQPGLRGWSSRSKPAYWSPTQFIPGSTLWKWQWKCRST
ncbi:ROK family protein [Pseudomonas sp. 14P_5.3_Bac1]|uniref:ROK family protein n=1 Tax=Pseudomonas sp. 14P_5.3_Bac1 TaxID=2971622 RepID=UPI0021C595BA|nr:ROK family protein [Pseudomonas sp. 14P_5.3_Bac1]MCU1780383.1 ROK family protein [Pseudomonas sp. 14P_5.3_Bac1]